MAKISIQYIEGCKGRITYGVGRDPMGMDEEAYKKFLKERGLIDIDGKTCYAQISPENQP